MDHFAERLTGPGRGAVAVIRFHCSQLTADHPADSLFQSVGGRSLSQCKVGKITYGDWRQEDVVVVRISSNQWEVNCHGGPAPVQRILKDLQAAGIKNTDDQRSTIEGKQNATDMHASLERQGAINRRWQQLLLKSKTIVTANLILSQPDALQGLTNRLNECQDVHQATEIVKHFLSWKSFADHLVEPWVVAIVGEPNAGKSSFLNAVVGYQRSIVFEQPGTTRDLVQCDVVIAGWPVQLVDTAGIRSDSQDDIELRGISAAKNMIQAADLCIVISDQNTGWSDQDGALLDLARQRIPVCVVHNKSDLPAADHMADEPGDIDSFSVTSTTGEGIQPVLEWVANALVPVVPSANEPLPVLAPFVEACETFLITQQLPRLRQELTQHLGSLLSMSNG